MGYRLVHVLGVLELRVFINTFLDKYLFKGGERTETPPAFLFLDLELFP